MDEYDISKIVIEKNYGNAKIVCTNGEMKFDMSIKCAEFIKNIDYIKNLYNLKSVGYLHQVHSTVIKEFNGIPSEGDAIITDEKQVALGVFTADCVPILLYDKKKEVIAAIHSGWKGTYDEITLKTLMKMKEKYDVKGEDIIAVIGPHIRKCCYEVSDDLVNSFKSKEIYKSININHDRNLDLSSCIEAQLKQFGVKEKNILDMALCTKCNEDTMFHSYRRDKEKSGRNFSFIFIS